MNNSTPNSDSSSAQPPTAPTNKTLSKSGPIRTGLVAPLMLLLVLVYIYFAFFFDLNAKHLLMSLASRANGAEVDIAHLHTSFWDASLEIRDIQVTKHDEPAKNSIEIGRVEWHMLWDALLRGKIAIDTASILEVRIGTVRKHVGFVLPPDPPKSTTESQQRRKETLDRVEKEFSGNMFGDVAALLNGGGPKEQLKNLEGSLKSEAKVKELQIELSQKQKDWQSQLKSLPEQKDLNALNDRLKKVKTSNFKNPSELQASLSEISGIANDANKDLQQVQATAHSLNADVLKYQNAMKDLDQLVREDVSNLKSRFKIPKLDADSMARILFGPTVYQKLKQAEFYMSQAREYMPPKKTAAQKAEEKAEIPKAHERHKGRNYKFGTPHAYPLFWLKKAEISSKSQGSEFAGDLSGSINNLTDDPPTLGEPTSLVFRGDFPLQQIHGIKGELIIDHVNEVPRESFDLQVASLALKDMTLVNSEETKIGFKTAQGDSNFLLDLQGPEVKMKIGAGFDNVDYAIDAKNKMLADILSKTFAGLPKVTMQAGVDGTWEHLNFKIDSNLARELQAGFARQLQAKISEAQAKVQELIDGRIGEQRQKLLDQFAGVQNQIKRELAGKQAEIDKAKNSLDKAKNDAVKGQSKQLQDQGKKALDQLKSKFGF